MTNWIDIINFAAAVGGTVIALLGLLLNLSLRYMEKQGRRFFTMLFVLLLAYVASDLLSQISLILLGPAYAVLSKIAVFAESLFSSLLIPMLTMYLLTCAGEAWRRHPMFYTVAVLWLTYFALLVVTQFTTAIYTVTPENVYLRGPLYPLLLIPPALLMLVVFAVLLRYRKNLSKRQRRAFAVYLLLPLVCMLVQMAVYGLLMIVIGSSIAALFLFLSILMDQVERTIAQRAENARQRTSIRALQMRPHFIHNTLMSIYYLCRQDPEKAQAVTLDFASYLGKSFNAIAENELIPFTEELEHTRAYLAVEKARFEEQLFVEFDTPHTFFKLPPLTLQPVVENAVKHGISPQLGPLYLSVHTCATEEGSEITVEDTGPGFSPADNNEPHVALANIRDRLTLMCGGTLEIESREAGGTKVTICVPAKSRNT